MLPASLFCNLCGIWTVYVPGIPGKPGRPGSPVIIQHSAYILTKITFEKYPVLH